MKYAENIQNRVKPLLTIKLSMLFYNDLNPEVEWMAWARRRVCMAYEFVCESEAKRYRSDCSNVLKKTCELLKEKGVSAQFRLLEAEQGI